MLSPSTVREASQHPSTVNLQLLNHPARQPETAQNYRTNHNTDPMKETRTNPQRANPEPIQPNLDLTRTSTTDSSPNPISNQPAKQSSQITLILQPLVVFTDLLCSLAAVSAFSCTCVWCSPAPVFLVLSRGAGLPFALLPCYSFLSLVQVVQG